MSSRYSAAVNHVHMPRGVHPFDSLDDIIFMLDADGRLTFANTCALSTWQKTEQEVLGRPLEEALAVQMTPEVADAFRQAQATQKRTEVETVGVHSQGRFGLTLSPHHGGLIVQARALRSDDPLNDALTGCLTRLSFQSAMRGLNLPSTLAIVDLNRLKAVNTLRGHSGGDLYIRTVAHALQEVLPPGALICRWGGDEFVILAPGADMVTLQDILEATWATTPGPVPGLPSFSLGLAVWEEGTPYERAFALADEQLQQRKAQLDEARPMDGGVHSFVQFSQRLEALQNPDDIIQHALTSLLDLLDFDVAVYAPWEGENNYASHQASREGMPAPQPPLHVRVPIASSGLVSQVRRTHQTAWSTDYPSDAEHQALILRQGVKSVIITPVFGQGRIIATLVLRTINRWHSITPQMRTIMELTALRLEHALELRRVVDERRAALDAGLLTLGIVLETRDAETHGHTERAATMAVRLGELLGLGPVALDQLRKGAYLHDFGKLNIPDEILRKPGRLTSEEWATMQSHAAQGHDLASRIPGLSSTVLEIIRSHHERWDGNGYPDGLMGTAIPLAARIFAVCDVYDALISERPYKKAWSHEAACEEIRGASGQHFDPAVVDAFLRLNDLLPGSQIELAVIDE